MTKIFNLTQHAATADQLAAGVFEPADKAAVSALLTFEDCPTQAEIIRRAEALATLARQSGVDATMVGGAPYLMAPLEAALRRLGIRPLYAFSQRISVEEPDGQGGVRKSQIFRHAGWVDAGDNPPGVITWIATDGSRQSIEADSPILQRKLKDLVLNRDRSEKTAVSRFLNDTQLVFNDEKGLSEEKRNSEATLGDLVAGEFGSLRFIEETRPSLMRYLINISLEQDPPLRL